MGIKIVDDFEKIGLHISEKEKVFKLPPKYTSPQSIKKDIFHMFNAIEKYSKTYENNVENFEKLDKDKANNVFPFSEMREIIKYYTNNGLFIYKFQKYKSSSLPKNVNWARTIKNNLRKSIGTHLHFDNYIVFENVKDLERDITNIFKIAVNISIKAIGFIISPHLKTLKIDKKYSQQKILNILNKLHHIENIEHKKNIIQNMILIFSSSTFSKEKKDVSYIKESEYFFEKMINDVFGNQNASDYNLKSSWWIENNEIKNSVGRPDTIHKSSNKVYIIDSKYYKFIYGNKSSLPATSDVIKQIAYSNYLKHINNKDVYYNIFVLPSPESGIRYIGKAVTGSNSIYAFGVNFKELVECYIGTRDTNVYINQIKEFFENKNQG